MQGSMTVSKSLVKRKSVETPMMSAKRQYALCVLPALPDKHDCTFYSGANRAAREFVRLVSVDEAQNALVREYQKYG